MERENNLHGDERTTHFLSIGCINSATGADEAVGASESE
jgi:hypothetical protein